jgi:hypothetical protein
MELLELDPPDLGITTAGIYVVDDDGAQILAGPFPDETDALAWIEQTRANAGIAPDTSPLLKGRLGPLEQDEDHIEVRT